MTMLESIKKYTGADFAATKTAEEAEALAKSIGIEFEGGRTQTVKRRDYKPCL